MKYYQIIVDSSGKKECLHLFNESLPFSSGDLEQGIDLSGVKVDEVIVPYKKNEKIQDWASVILPVVSERFKNIIESVNHGGFQFFPIIAEREDKKEWHKLYVINYLKRIDAIDIKKSETAKIFKGELSIITPKIIESKTEDLDIFRLNSTTFAIFVSERLANLIKKNKLTGFKLRPTIE